MGCIREILALKVATLDFGRVVKKVYHMDIIKNFSKRRMSLENFWSVIRIENIFWI